MEKRKREILSELTGISMGTGNNTSKKPIGRLLLSHLFPFRPFGAAADCKRCYLGLQRRGVLPVLSSAALKTPPEFSEAHPRPPDKSHKAGSLSA